MTTPQDTILIVDDQSVFAQGMARLLDKEFPGVRSAVATSGEQALELLAAQPVSLMLSDLRMPGMSGLELLGRALEAEPALSVVMITGYGSIESAVEALKAGAYDFLTKPVDRESLVRVVAKGLERARLLGENRRLRALVAQAGSLQTLLGRSQAMNRLRETIVAVAASDYTVLINGESGTGKEMVARTIHNSSPRAARHLVSVNCPAIPDHLLESELFGHVKGAFTGADRNRKGLFLAAHGGTLLLDEIGDIPMNVQTKLLRVLQEREVRPVGANESTPVDVRILASTNQNLEAKMQAGDFREDLFYRLNVLHIHVPPLRQRADDVPLLAHHFLTEACRDMGLPPKDIAPEVLAFLAARPWPGNVRELQNFMRRLAVFARTPTVDLALVRLADNNAGGPADADTGLPPYKDAKSKILDDFTRTYVRQLLAMTEGNISQAARISGLERVSLQKILRRLDIDAERYR
jgi:DNA-binding NtrC family response regulator